MSGRSVAREFARAFPKVLLLSLWTFFAWFVLVTVAYTAVQFTVAFWRLAEVLLSP
jgi:hypothetical protein